MKFNPIKSVAQFWTDSIHILSISNKPSTDEFKRTLKVVLLGALALGTFGFIISFVVGLIV